MQILTFKIIITCKAFDRLNVIRYKILFLLIIAMHDYTCMWLRTKQELDK